MTDLFRTTAWPSAMVFVLAAPAVFVQVDVLAAEDLVAGLLMTVAA
jgi:hypothetical protein